MPADASAAPALTVAGVTVPYSLISLCVLTAQNSLLAILLHYSRTAPDAKPFSAAAAVLLNEILKGSISFVVALNNVDNSPAPSTTSARYATADNGVPFLGNHEKPRGSGLTNGSKRTASLGGGALSLGGVPDDALKRRRNNSKQKSPTGWAASPSQWVMRARRVSGMLLSPDCWKLAIPATCYVLQNNLQFVAAENLDVATFQVSYQMKILTTALFSVTMLNRRLSVFKWGCLLALALGVAIVQLQGTDNGSRAAIGHPHGDRVTGLLAVLMACMTSGFAGVYFEMVLKGTAADLWIRNIQLTLFSLPPAIVAILFPAFSIRTIFSSSAPVKYSAVQATPWLFENFGFWAWATVLCQVFGGLMTALVIKYSDNIAKGFATSLSIIISFIAGIILFDFPVSMPFLVGCTVVLAATWFYNQPEPETSKPRSSGPYQPLRNGSIDEPRFHSYAVDMQEDHSSPPRFGSTGTVGSADPAYPFAEYAQKGGRPPEFTTLSPFTTPIVASPKPPDSGEISPRSPVPPNGDVNGFFGGTSVPHSLTGKFA